MKRRATKFNKTVTIISLTPSLTLSTAGTNPKDAPKINPVTKAKATPIIGTTPITEMPAKAAAKRTHVKLSFCAYIPYPALKC